MEKDFLENCLAKGMSLPRIGELTGRTPSTVGYWVAKHGLVANGRKKFSPGKAKAFTRGDLEPLVMEGLTIARIADELDVSPNCVRYWIGEYGLPQPIEVRRTLTAHARKVGDTRSKRVCRQHGETQFLMDIRGTWRCRLCRQARVAERRRKVKKILVEEAGGACALCGYDRSDSALHFHHRDPADKRFTISHSGYTVGIDKARREAAKCVLLCANCHAEVEGGLAQAPPPGIDGAA